MKIGFIGLGIMGSRMAANLQKGGHSLVVYNRTRDKSAPLIADGAKWADSPAALAAQAEIVFTMLASPTAVREAALGEDGFLSHLAPSRLWVDCSTVNPSFSREMAEQARGLGVRFLDAPVTGSKDPAALGKLVFWVGGDAADLEACRSFLNCMGNKIVHAGSQGMGTSLKMVMNQLLGTVMAAFAEGLVLGESLGLSREVLFDSILGGAAAAPFLALKRERIEKGNYDQADFPLRWLQKDLHLASVTAYETGVAMPLTNVAKEIYRFAIREGDGDKDFSAIYDYLVHNHDVQSMGKERFDKSDDQLVKSQSAASLRFLRTFAVALLPGIFFLAGFSASGEAANDVAQAGDSSLGRSFFQQNCAICHAASLGLRNAVIAQQGPSLVGVFGRRAGSGSNFNYTKALRACFENMKTSAI